MAFDRPREADEHTPDDRRSRFEAPADNTGDTDEVDVELDDDLGLITERPPLLGDDRSVPLDAPTQKLPVVTPSTGLAAVPSLSTRPSTDEEIAHSPFFSVAPSLPPLTRPSDPLPPDPAPPSPAERLPAVKGEAEEQEPPQREPIEVTATPIDSPKAGRDRHDPLTAEEKHDIEARWAQGAEEQWQRAAAREAELWDTLDPGSIDNTPDLRVSVARPPHNRHSQTPDVTWGEQSIQQPSQPWGPAPGPEYPAPRRAPRSSGSPCGTYDRIGKRGKLGR